MSLTFFFNRMSSCIFIILRQCFGLVRLPRYICNVDVECVICMTQTNQKINKENIMVITECCKQIFCLQCLKTWNHQFKETCPMCRKNMGYIL